MVSGSGSPQQSDQPLAPTRISNAVIGDAGKSAPALPFTGADAGNSIGRLAVGGAFWVFLAFVTIKVLGVATNLILARLLSPEDFGLVGFAMILISAFTILQDLGVQASVVQSDRDVRVIGGTALTINIVASVLLFVAAIFAAPLMARFGGNDAMAPIVIALAISLVVMSLGSVQKAMIVKELAFRRKYVPDIVPLLLSGVTSVTLAFLGFGAWSLVYGHLVKAASMTFLLWLLSDIRPWPSFQRPIASELLSYGKHVSLASIIGFIGINLDYFIIGHVLGTYDLGLYVLAFTIANLPVQLIGQTAQSVMFPAYSRIRNDLNQLMNLYEDTFTVLAALAIPASIVLVIAGPTYVPILFGEKWASIGPALQILAVYGALRTLAMGFTPFYKAIGRPSADWKLNLFRIALLAPLMLLLVRYGVTGIPVAYLILACIFIPLNGFIMCRIVETPVRRFATLVAHQGAGVLVAGLVTLAWYALPGASDVAGGPVGSLGLALTAVSAYFLTIVAVEPRVITLVRAALATYLRRRHVQTS